MKRLILLTAIATIILSACQNINTKKEMNDNPFFTEWTTPHGVPPFDLIKEEHFIPAFEMAIENQNKEIERIQREIIFLRSKKEHSLKENKRLFKKFVRYYNKIAKEI